LTHYAGYNEEEIQPVFKLMVDYLARPVTHEAFFKKYASKKFLKGKLSHIHNRNPTNFYLASILTRQWAKKNAVELGVDVSLPLDMAR
jgi:G2/mitotic-specific cyclin 1/2